MKKNIHPNWVTATVVCACGNTFQTQATKPLLKLDICSQCHPFYTGQQRIVDTAGQVDRFMRRLNARQKSAAERQAEAEAGAEGAPAETTAQ